MVVQTLALPGFLIVLKSSTGLLISVKGYLVCRVFTLSSGGEVFGRLVRSLQSKGAQEVKVAGEGEGVLTKHSNHILPRIGQHLIYCIFSKTSVPWVSSESCESLNHRDPLKGVGGLQ